MLGDSKKPKRFTENLIKARSVKSQIIREDHSLPPYARVPRAQRLGVCQRRAVKSDLIQFRGTGQIRTSFPFRSVILTAGRRLRQDLISQFPNNVVIEPTAMILIAQAVNLWEQQEIMRRVLESQGDGSAVFIDTDGTPKQHTIFAMMLTTQNALRRALSQLDGYLREARTQHARSGGRGKAEMSVIDLFRRTQLEKVECGDRGRGEDAGEEEL